VAREVGTKTWYIITSNMFARMQTAGVVEGFKEFTVLGDVFSVSV
jgi:hypothetical protein